jgi:hypothetical protein
MLTNPEHFYKCSRATTVHSIQQQYTLLLHPTRSSSSRPKASRTALPSRPSSSHRIGFPSMIQKPFRTRIPPSSSPESPRLEGHFTVLPLTPSPPQVQKQTRPMAFNRRKPRGQFARMIGRGEHTTPFQKTQLPQNCAKEFYNVSYSQVSRHRPSCLIREAAPMTFTAARAGSGPVNFDYLTEPKCYF